MILEEEIQLSEEQKQMIIDNLALATSIAKKYLNKVKNVSNDDIIQESRIAFIKAVKNYDPKIAKLSTYVYKYIDGHLIRYCFYKDRIIPIPHQRNLKDETIEKKNNAKYVHSLDKKYSYSNQEEYTIMDMLSLDYNLEQETINKIVLEEAIKSLNWREKIVIIYRFYFDLCQTNIGDLIGISQVHTHRLEKKALYKMRSYIEESNK